VALGPAEILAGHLAGMARERDPLERDNRLLPQFEEMIAAIVQQRNPVRRNLVEQRTSIDSRRESKQRVEERRALGGGADDRIGEHREVRTDSAIEAEAAVLVEEHRLV